jgi:hypothetical protein
MPFAHRPHGFLRTRLVWAGTAVLTTVLTASAITAAQTSALDRLMRQKLDHSQAILAAVVTSNWPELQRHSQALIDLTGDPAWTVLKTPEYATQSEAFVRAARELVAAATRRDLDGTPVAYMSLTLRCVECHRYVARTRIANVSPDIPVDARHLRGVFLAVSQVMNAGAWPTASPRKNARTS